MKKKRTQKQMRPSLGNTLASDFTRGFIATGLLTAFQDRAQRSSGDENGPTFDDRRMLRHALQGGVALASGSAVAEALTQRNVLHALLAVAVGATTVFTIEQSLRQNSQNAQTTHQETGYE